tara:strand:- start:102953 stop:104539 length:1587 start_codon:yes stop_codon:yes gene_type:complete
MTAHENITQVAEWVNLNGQRMTRHDESQKPKVDVMPDALEYTTRARSLAHSAIVIYNMQGVEADDKKEALIMLCESEGLRFPRSRFGLAPSAKRLFDAQWWVKKLVKKSRREFEARRIADGMVNERRELYCTDWAVMQWRAMRKKNQEFMQEMFVFNDDAWVANLATIAEHSLANPAVRRAEMMTRLAGMEEYAISKNDRATFITITCPSKFHANSSRYKGYTPKQAQEYLCSVWAKIRAKLARMGIEQYGFRVAEPHNDGCPHWHAIIFASPENIAAIERVCLVYALKEDGNERGAIQNRFKKERIKMRRGDDGFKGGAVAYIAKYISKNIDGLKNDGSTIGDVTDRDGNVVADDAIVTAERVLAWASIWGIRQFQQFGGERIGPWRELRRVRDAITSSAVLEIARAAADNGDFCLYLEAAQRVADLKTLKRCDFEVAYDDGDFDAARAGLNQFGEPVIKVVGVIGDGERIVTRRDDWRCMTEAAIHACYDEAADEGDAVEYWSDVVEFLNVLRAAKDAELERSCPF